MASGRRSPSPEPPGPQPIRRLHESLINRIAAGEIIHRPASALKELLENCLDAGSTSIQVTVKDGGMKLLQIQDNGCGIRKEDLPLLAERFTTSKLTTFSDLSKLTTYGFRGEALASISHVAHLTVITKTKSSNCAWKAAYVDGGLVPSKAGYTPDPKPCAGNNGTTITIEDMFYNTPTRLSALRSSSEEYVRILDVMTKYAVHNSKVSFSCKKAGSLSPELSTPSCSDASQAIRQLYGHSIAKELLHVTASSAWSADAYFTNANYQGKKIALLLFINHRLVESHRIKRSIESIYSGILPKGSSPFVYLSINLDPRSVDVNVHPTKREVHFLNEEAIIERISDAIQQRLATQSQSRVFEYQTLLTGGIAQSASRKGKEKASNADRRVLGSQVAKKVLSQHKVRTSLQDRTLDSMIPVADPLRTNSDEPVTAIRLRDIKQSTCHFASITELRRLATKRIHHDLTEIIKKHTFIGVIDLSRCLALIQHNKNLYMVNHAALAEEMFYQLALLQFGDYNRLKLDPPPSLRTLIKFAVDVEEDTARSGMSNDEIVDRIVKTLMDRREMLHEYFSLDISETGDVKTLPHLLREYTPNLDKLPMFLMRLGPQVLWESEQECFGSFMRELAYFYSPAPLSVVSAAASDEDEQEKQKSEAWRIQNILFHAMRKYLAAPKFLLDNDIVQVASLPDLYRVFERC
ncbi:histidine kinase-like ATPase [Suillus fuscotomentosus]|uniref:Histidine kinase-like ATPase n=1 Tax=Suillus fuscotomentosus TaxID=1912939 RepID=A0AAD4EC70_9AGAM|nr:histidine kinase-like ATPase [Suillus fuscotomentosus]KAG1903457.1 histidine kinase-like ATPase [Suillus fuscotomentosus]